MKTKQFNKTIIELAVSSAILSSALLSSVSIAADDINDQANKNAQVVNLEQIVVTANRSQQTQFLSLSSTQVIGKAEIEAIQPQNITELLNTVAGVTVANLGSPGQAASVYMRGTNTNHTLVLVDGVRVGSATLGTASFSSISVGLIDRIEVVKGPRGALWGSDAIGGVIQIFTKKLHSDDGYVKVGVGNNGFWKTEAAFGLGNDKHLMTLAGAVEESDGFNATDYDGQTDDDGFDRQSFSINGQSQLTNELLFDLVSRYETGGSQFDSQWGGDDENEYKNYSIKVGGVYTLTNILLETSLAKSQDQGGSFAGNADPKVVTDITTKRDQFGLLAQYELSENTSFVAGFDWYKDSVSNTASTYTRDTRNSTAAFIQARHQVNGFLLEGAVRKDDVQRIGEKDTYNLSVGYQFDDNWLLSVSQGSGFKVPTFNDLYWPESGNSSLNPEEVKSKEILLRNQFDNGSVEISVYDAEIENLIAWAEQADKSWLPSNINNATTKGIDLTVSLQTNDFSHLLAAGYVNAKDKATEKALIRRPKVKATYTLGYQVEALTANIVLDYRGDSEGSSRTLKSALLTNISLAYQITDKLSVTSKVNNLFDKDYTVAEHYLTGGINYQLAATYTF